MRILLQRVRAASVQVDNREIARIGNGVVLLVGIGHDDGEAQAAYLAQKVAELRIFEDEAGKMNLSLKDVGGAALAVSQFTLYADTRKGRRPSFTNAALPEKALPLFNRFVELLQAEGIPVQTGEFGAHMLVEIHNDGPVTLWLERS